MPKIALRTPFTLWRDKRLLPSSLDFGLTGLKKIADTFFSTPFFLLFRSYLFMEPLCNLHEMSKHYANNGCGVLKGRLYIELERFLTKSQLHSN